MGTQFIFGKSVRRSLNRNWCIALEKGLQTGRSSSPHIGSRRLATTNCTELSCGMNTPCRGLIIAFLGVVSTAFTACGRGDKASIPANGAPFASYGTALILLFNGTGTSPNDVAAVETILNSNQLNYTT